MQLLYRIITPAIVMMAVLMASYDGDYIIAVAASIILGLICYRMMDDPAINEPLPDIIERGPEFVTFNDEIYPEWLKTEDGRTYIYDGLREQSSHLPGKDCLHTNGLVYHGVKYRLERGSEETNASSS